jgi:hypothetical protein
VASWASLRESKTEKSVPAFSFNGSTLVSEIVDIFGSVPVKSGVMLAVVPL